MNDISLKLQTREIEGKKVARLRAEGLVPSVIYGGHQEPIKAQSAVVDTTRVVREAGKHTPVNLTIDGKKRLAMIKSVDYDPVRHVVRHVSFHAVKQNEIIEAEVPIVLIGVGESPAERAGLVVLQALERIQIKAKPAALPEALELSVEGLSTTEDKLTLADIKLPEGVVYADNEQDVELVIANVYEPSALQAANEAAGGEAEPEAAEDVEAENGGEESGEEKPEAASEEKK